MCLKISVIRVKLPLSNKPIGNVLRRRQRTASLSTHENFFVLRVTIKADFTLRIRLPLLAELE